MAVAAALFAAPAALADTTTIGETALLPNAANLDNIGQNTPVFQGDTSGGYVTSSPVSGTITSWSFLSGGATTGNMFVLRVLSPTDATGADWRAIATSDPVAVTSATGVDAVNGPFPANLAIQAGERIALQPVTDGYVPIETGVNGQDGIRFFDSPLADGSSATVSAGSVADNGQVVPIQASVDFVAQKPPPPPPPPPPPLPPPAPPQDTSGNAPGMFQAGDAIYYDQRGYLAYTPTLGCGTGTWSSLPIPSGRDAQALAYAHAIAMQIVRTGSLPARRTLAAASLQGTMSSSTPPFWDNEPANPLATGFAAPFSYQPGLYNSSRAFYGATNVKIASVTGSYTDPLSNTTDPFETPFYDTNGMYPAGIGNADPNLPGQGVLFRAFVGADAAGQPQVSTFLVYHLAASDLGTTIQCRVAATNGGSNPASQATGQAVSASYKVSRDPSCAPTEFDPPTRQLPSFTIGGSAGSEDIAGAIAAGIAGWMTANGQNACITPVAAGSTKPYRLLRPQAPLLTPYIAGGKAAVGVPCALAKGCAGATLRVLATASALRRSARAAAARQIAIGHVKIPRTRRSVLLVRVPLSSRARARLSRGGKLSATAQLIERGKVVLSAQLLIERVQNRKH